MPWGAAVLIARATGQCLLFIFEKEEGQGQKPEGCLGAGWASPSNLNSVSLWKSQLQLTPVGLILRNQTDLKNLVFIALGFWGWLDGRHQGYCSAACSTAPACSSFDFLIAVSTARAKELRLARQHILSPWTKRGTGHVAMAAELSRLDGSSSQPPPAQLSLP